MDTGCLEMLLLLEVVRLTLEDSAASAIACFFDLLKIVVRYTLFWIINEVVIVFSCG